MRGCRYRKLREKTQQMTVLANKVSGENPARALGRSVEKLAVGPYRKIERTPHEPPLVNAARALEHRSGRDSDAHR